MVENLQGVRYLWKSNEYPERHFSDARQIGLVAQDVEQIVPEVVTTDSEGYKSIDYSKLTAILIEAVKEQQREIAELKQLVLENSKKNIK
jgi:hypothetical protein